MKKGYLLVFLTAIISGFSIFINKYGVGLFTNSYLFTFLKNTLVAIFLTSLLFLFKDWKKLKSLTKREWALLVVVGLVGGSIPFLLFFKGLSLTSAAEGSFIHKTIFIYVTLLAFLFLKEKIDKKFFFGASILLFANALLLKKFSFHLNFGNLLVLIATLFWAAENTISKYLLRNLEGRQVAWARMFFGSLFILLFLLTTNQLSSLTLFDFKQINWIIITALILFGYVITWYSGLKYIPASRATVILLLGSPITTLISLISGGKINLQEILSGFLIILGIVFVIGLKESWQFLKEIKKLIYART